MKEHLRRLLAGETPTSGRNRVREYLQARLLRSLQRSGAMIPLAFHGGTALRFLYGMPRYSEDLVVADVRPFLETEEEVDLLSLENLRKLLDR